MHHSIQFTGPAIVTGITILLLAGCAEEQAAPPPTTEPAVVERDDVAIAEATAAAVKIILEDDTAVSNRIVPDSCGEPHAGTMFPGFGGPNPVDLPPPNQEFLKIGADRPAVETDQSRVSDGFVLFSPGHTTDTLLVDNDGNIVATNTSPNTNGHSTLLDNGNVLRTDAFDVGSHGWPEGRGIRGCVLALTWDGEILWQAGMTTDDYVQHHDVVPLPNGNFLTNVWLKTSIDELVRAGRNPEDVPERGEFWFDAIWEVNPRTHEVVWEWNSADHLVQEFDAEADNYGVVADHPERIDINKFPRGQNGGASHDWLHGNALDYNVELDQIVLSTPTLGEFWIIDHSTTTAEAASSSGGRYGKGGDLLYRWGNPQNYNRGSSEDRKLFAQHNTHWIPSARPGAGNILVFNNGGQPRQWTTVLELEMPVNEDGSYTMPDDGPWGPGSPAWEYDPAPPERFYSWYISGAERLPNGNTLVNQGAGARFREVAPEGDIVWEYRHEDPDGQLTGAFRAEWYSPDHPGIQAIGLSDRSGGG